MSALSRDDLVDFLDEFSRSIATCGGSHAESEQAADALIRLLAEFGYEEPEPEPGTTTFSLPDEPSVTIGGEGWQVTLTGERLRIANKLANDHEALLKYARQFA